MSLPMATRERRDELPLAVFTLLALGIATAAALAWTRGGWLALAPDDATYLSVGRNVLAGAGPMRLDEPYLLRSPLFGGLLALPGRLGFDLITGAHWANLAFTIGACLAAAGVAWRLWGVPAGLLALGIAVAQPLAARFAPTLRIDAVAALFVLLAVMLSVDLGQASGSGRWRAILVGILLGLAFLIKETTLALAGAIVLIPFAIGRPGAIATRDAVLVGAAAVLTSSWWLVWHALLAGRLPYIALPAGAVVPLVAGAVAALLVAWRWGAAGPAGSGRSPALGRGADWLPTMPGLRWLGCVLGTLAWSLVMTAGAIIGTGQRPPSADLAHLAGRFVELVPLWPLLLSTLLLGVILAPRSPALVGPTLPAVGFLPIGALAISYNFGARNFLVWSLLAASAAAGLLWLAATWLRHRSRGRTLSRVPAQAPLFAVLALVVAGAGLGMAATAPVADLRREQLESDLRELAQRLRSLAPAGSTIVVTSPYGSHLDLLLGDHYQVRRLSPVPIRVEPRSPTGLARNTGDRGAVGEVVALTYQESAGALLAFETKPAIELLQQQGTRLFVYITYPPVDPPWLVQRFGRANGFSRVDRLHVGERRRAYIYRLDDDRLELGGQPMLTDPRSLEALLDLLERRLKPRAKAAALRALLPQGVDLGASEEDAAAKALQRLRRAMRG